MVTRLPLEQKTPGSIPGPVANWTKFCFLDETGTLSDQKDQYFTVGMLKMSQHCSVENISFLIKSAG